MEGIDTQNQLQELLEIYFQDDEANNVDEEDEENSEQEDRDEDIAPGLKQFLALCRERRMVWYYIDPTDNDRTIALDTNLHKIKEYLSSNDSLIDIDWGAHKPSQQSLQRGETEASNPMALIWLFLHGSIMIDDLAFLRLCIEQGIDTTTWNQYNTVLPKMSKFLRVLATNPDTANNTIEQMNHSFDGIESILPFLLDVIGISLDYLEYTDEDRSQYQEGACPFYIPLIKFYLKQCGQYPDLYSHKKDSTTNIPKQYVYDIIPTALDSNVLSLLTLLIDCDLISNKTNAQWLEILASSMEGKGESTISSNNVFMNDFLPNLLANNTNNQQLHYAVDLYLNRLQRSDDTCIQRLAQHIVIALYNYITDLTNDDITCNSHNNSNRIHPTADNMTSMRRQPITLPFDVNVIEELYLLLLTIQDEIQVKTSKGCHLVERKGRLKDVLSIEERFGIGISERIRLEGNLFDVRGYQQWRNDQIQSWEQRENEEEEKALIESIPRKRKGIRPTFEEDVDWEARRQGTLIGNPPRRAWFGCATPSLVNCPLAQLIRTTSILGMSHVVMKLLSTLSGYDIYHSMQERVNENEEREEREDAVKEYKRFVHFAMLHAAMGLQVSLLQRLINEEGGDINYIETSTLMLSWLNQGDNVMTVMIENLLVPLRLYKGSEGAIVKIVEMIRFVFRDNEREFILRDYASNEGRGMTMLGKAMRLWKTIEWVDRDEMLAELAKDSDDMTEESTIMTEQKRKDIQERIIEESLYSQNVQNTWSIVYNQCVTAVVDSLLKYAYNYVICDSDELDRNHGHDIDECCVPITITTMPKKNENDTEGEYESIGKIVNPLVYVLILSRSAIQHGWIMHWIEHIVFEYGASWDVTGDSDGSKTVREYLTESGLSEQQQGKALQCGKHLGSDQQKKRKID